MTDPAPRRDGPHYRVLGQEREQFARDGFVHLPGVVSEEEIAELEAVYECFLRREIAVPGRDFCDMSGSYDRPMEEFEVVNVMLPRRYHPSWQNNVYEQRVASIAEQLCGPGMVLDYDQLLAKPPRRPGGEFAWHQDQAYWPVTADPRTATAWLAFDDTDEENGCMRFVPGSHREPALRTHAPKEGDRDASHTLVGELREDDRIRSVPIRRGDVTVHCERVLHGSGGNRSDGWRRAYIVAFRAAETVAEERARGFTHSHNDAKDVLDGVGE